MNSSFLESFLDACDRKAILNYDLCALSACLHNLSYIHVTQWMELFLDFVSIFSVLYLVRTSQFKKIGAIVNPSLKLIAITGLGFYILGTTFSMFLHLYLKVLSFRTISSDCDYLWTPIGCLAYRLPVYYAFVGFNVFHLMLSIERASVAFGCSTEKDIWFGQFSVVLMIIFPGIFTVWTFFGDDFVNLRPYCLLYSSENTIYSLMISGLILAVSDIITTILDIFIYFYNKNQLKSKLRGYTLSRKFQLKETQISMRLVFPFAVIHSTIYTIFMAMVILFTYATMKMDTDRDIQALQILGLTKALYLTGVPVLVLAFRFKQAKETDEWLVKQDYANVYFQQFKRQIK